VFSWIFVPAYLTMIGYLSSDIVDGTCIPFGYSNYATSSILLIITYLFPLMAMLFCYTRIVYKLRSKVNPLVTTTVNFNPLKGRGVNRLHLVIHV